MIIPKGEVSISATAEVLTIGLSIVPVIVNPTVTLLSLPISIYPTRGTLPKILPISRATSMARSILIVFYLSQFHLCQPMLQTHL